MMNCAMICCVAIKRMSGEYLRDGLTKQRVGHIGSRKETDRQWLIYKSGDGMWGKLFRGLLAKGKEGWATHNGLFCPAYPRFESITMEYNQRAACAHSVLVGCVLATMWGQEITWVGLPRSSA
jgi:hypothetical protein